MKINLPLLLDSVLSKIVCFVFGMLTAGYFLRNITDVFLFALIFSGCGSEIYLSVISPERKPCKPDRRQLATRETFVYADDRFALEFFRSALGKKYEIKRCRKFIGVRDTALFCRIKPSPLTADAFIDMYAYAVKHGYKKLVVLTDSYAPQTLEAARNIPDGSARLLNFDEVYRLIKSLKAEPAVKVTEKRRDKKAFFKSMLNRKRANGYLLCAVTLFIMSAFVSYSVYYIAAACAVLALSFIARFMPKESES